MKFEINQDTLNVLNQVKDCILLYKDELMVIKHIETEKGEVKFGYRNKKSRPALFLTKCELKGYSKKGGFIGIYTTSDQIEYLIDNHNLYDLRNNWTAFKNQLKAFGYEINEIRKPRKQKKQ